MRHLHPCMHVCTGAETCKQFTACVKYLDMFHFRACAICCGQDFDGRRRWGSKAVRLSWRCLGFTENPASSGDWESCVSCVTLQPGVAAGAGALHVLPALAIKRVVLAFVSTVLSFLVFQTGMGGSGGSLVVHAIVYAHVLTRVHARGLSPWLIQLCFSRLVYCEFHPRATR